MTNSDLCLVSPHPALQERLNSGFRIQFAPEATTRPIPLSGPTGHVLGLNDGYIFPESHFEGAPSRSRMKNAALEKAPLRGAIRVIVVLVEFSDKQMAPGAKAHFEELFFSTGKIPTRSVTEYYADVSKGNISLAGDVVGPFRMPRTMKQYAHGGSGFGDKLPNARTMATDALNAAKASVNFAPYDNDGNGFVDAFIVVHAGMGADESGDPNDIWSLKWVIEEEVTLNGVNIFGFLTIAENAQIGVCAHELGHLLFGWPDLYDTDGSSEGLGDWCLMAGGSWGGSPAGSTPCHPSAWCKQTQGWVQVVNETKNGEVTLEDVKTGAKVHRLWKDGAMGKEYFLVENRQRDGFDASLPGDGLLVWHVDESVEENTNEKHYKVALMQADGKNELATASASRGDAGDPFPGSSANKTFNATSKPNSRSYARKDTGVAITGISGPGKNMTFSVAVNKV